MDKFYPGRREFLMGAWGALPSESGPPDTIVVAVNVMFDAGAHSSRGLAESEVRLFNEYQEKARREFAVSGIAFDVQFTGGAFLRTQGESVIPDRFLLRRAINVFVTDALGYDIDRDRGGGSSIGPRPRRRRSPPDPFYKTFIGLKDARDTTLPHEYAHHFSLDTRHPSSFGANLWCDLRNDYLLWRQRHGASIDLFRACANAEWARVP